MERSTRSAEAGNDVAQSRLAMMYFHGIVVAVDYVEAAKWASLAVEQGNADAERILGEMFIFGHGVEIDLALAAHWLRSAAEKGEPRAQGLYGVLCALGAGVSKNWVEAVTWLIPAAREGDARACDFLREYGIGWSDTASEERVEEAGAPAQLHPPKYPLSRFYGKWRSEDAIIEFMANGNWQGEIHIDGVDHHQAGSWSVHGDRLLMRLESSDQPVDAAYIALINQPATVLHIDETELLLEDASDLSTIHYQRVIDEQPDHSAKILTFPIQDMVQPESKS
jgi:hypothetical protein